MARHARWGGDPVNRYEGGVFFRVTAGTPYSARQLSDGDIEVAVADNKDPEAALIDVRSRLADSLPVAPLRRLVRHDPVVAAAYRRRRGYRPPITPNLFESLVTSITAQQVNLTWATTTRTRLVERYGRRRRFPKRLLWEFPTDKVLAGARHGDIRELQFTNAKAASIIRVAQASAGGELDDLEQLPSADVVSRLTAIKGIGRWTADWTLARCFARPDVVAAGDLGVQKAVGAAYLGRRAAEDEVRRLTEPWGAAANWATHLLLEGLSDV